MLLISVNRKLCEPPNRQLGRGTLLGVDIGAKTIIN